MIDVIISSSKCPHCDQQKAIMQKSFFQDEYRFIEIGSKEFETLDVKEKVDAVPFIIVRNDDGSIKYAAKGALDGTSLHQIERLGAVVNEPVNVVLAAASFNLSRTRQYQQVGQLSRYMDA